MNEELKSSMKVSDGHQKDMQAQMDIFKTTVGWHPILSPHLLRRASKQYKNSHLAILSLLIPLSNQPAQLSALDSKVDRGPPGLWKVTEEVRMIFMPE